MLRRLLIIGLLIGSLTGCTPVTPTAPVAETPQTRIETPVGQLLATGTAPATTPTLPAMARGDLTMTILFDNTAIDARLGSVGVIRRINGALAYDISAGLSFDNMEYFISEMRTRLEKALEDS